MVKPGVWGEMRKLCACEIFGKKRVGVVMRAVEQRCGAKKNGCSQGLKRGAGRYDRQ